MNRVLAFLVLAILAAPMGALHFCQKETNKDGDALHVSRKVFRSAEKLNCGQTETLALIGLTSEFLTKGQALEGANAAQLEEKIAASTSALKGTLHKEECKESSVFSVKYSDLCESKLPSATEARLLCGDKKRFETLKDMSLVDVAVDFALESVGAEADDLKRAEGCEEGVSGQGGFLESSGTASLLTPRDTVSTVFLHRDGMALSERRGFTKTAVVCMLVLFYSDTASARRDQFPRTGKFWAERGLRHSFSRNLGDSCRLLFLSIQELTQKNLLMKRHAQ